VAQVPDGYPFRLEDEDLKNTLAEMMNPASWPGFADEFSRLLPELKLALLSAGLQEQARREAKKTAARTLIVTYAILSVSVLAVVAAVVIAATS
jgi:hypothetical protein